MPSYSLIKTLSSNLDIVTSLIHLEPLILSGSRDGSIKFFDVQNEFKEDSVLENVYKRGVRSMAALDNKVFAASGSDYSDKVVKIFNGKSKINIQTLILQTGFAVKLLKLRNGDLAAGASFPDNSIYIWNSKDNYSLIKRLNCHMGDINCLLETVDGLLISGSKYGEIIVHDINDDYNKKSYISVFSEGWVNDLILLLNGMIVSAHEKGFIKLWNSKMELLLTVNSENGAVTALCPLQENIFFSGSGDGTITLWKISSLSDQLEVIPLQKLTFHSEKIRDLITVNGYLVSASNDYSVLLWKDENF